MKMKMKMNMHSNLRTSILIAFISGLIYIYLMKLFWGYLPLVNPITHYLLDEFAGSAWYGRLVYIHDIIVNTMLSIPLAMILLKLRPSTLPLYILVALLPSFILYNYHLLNPENYSGNFAIFVPGWVLGYLTPFIALLIVWKFRSAHDT